MYFVLSALDTDEERIKLKTKYTEKIQKKAQMSKGMGISKGYIRDRE
jgi:hypothetical protein